MCHKLNGVILAVSAMVLTTGDAWGVGQHIVTDFGTLAMLLGMATMWSFFACQRYGADSSREEQPLRKATSILASLILLVVANATPSPAAAKTVAGVGYTATQASYEWTDISGTGTRILANNNYIANPMEWPAERTSIGFNFSFYGKSYDSVALTPYGVLDFTKNAYEPGPGSSGQGLPNSSSSSGQSCSYNMAAPYWGFLTTQKDNNPESDAVYYQTIGDPGSRRMIVQWQDAGSYFDVGQGTGSFQAVLYENTNQIKYQYKDVQFNNAEDSNGKHATIGVQGTVWSALVATEWSHNQASVQDQYAIQFNPTAIPAPVSLTANYTSNVTVHADASGQGMGYSQNSAHNTQSGTGNNATASAQVDASVELYGPDMSNPTPEGNPEPVWIPKGTRSSNAWASTVIEQANISSVRMRTDWSLSSSVSNYGTDTPASNGDSGCEAQLTGTLQVGVSDELPEGSPLQMLIRFGNDDSGGAGGDLQWAFKIWSDDAEHPLAVINGQWSTSNGNSAFFTVSAGDTLNFEQTVKRDCLNNMGSLDTPGFNSYGGFHFDVILAPIPEPSGLILLGIGAISLLAYAWQRQQAA